LLYSPLFATTTTSTQLPGVRKPATPEASSTFTVMARWLGLSKAVIPGTVPLGANLFSKMRSPGMINVAATRPSTSFRVLKEP
jgi:hypothetical protein